MSEEIKPFEKAEETLTVASPVPNPKPVKLTEDEIKKQVIEMITQEKSYKEVVASGFSITRVLYNRWKKETFPDNERWIRFGDSGVLLAYKHHLPLMEAFNVLYAIAPNELEKIKEQDIKKFKEEDVVFECFILHPYIYFAFNDSTIRIKKSDLLEFRNVSHV
jgi:hypothetical protein